MKKKLLTVGLGLLLISVGISLFLNKTVKPHKNSEFSSTSVMITRYDGRSGGTGVIISSSRNASKILTNAHVCALLNKGGIIRSDTAKGVVRYFQLSETHDLCLITTNTNFKVNTVVSERQPEPYDDAIVSGHPHLLPNIITKGHFSQKEIVSVLTGFKPCTIEDITNDATAPYCQFFGAIPIVKSYEAQIVSATIMPGSSGSAVFNDRGEISGVVFAGSGEFGYGMIVPQEYVTYFFEYELSNLPQVFPKNETDASKEEQSVDVKSACSKTSIGKIKNICDLISKNLLISN